MRRFQRIGGDRLRAAMTAEEARLLRDLAGQVAGLLLAGARDPGSPATPEASGVLAKLLPDAYRGDAEASAEFRRFTEADLVDRKVSNAETVIRCLASAPPTKGLRSRFGDVEVVLDRDQAQAWLRSLTDIRITIAARLGIETDDDEGRSGDRESEMMREIYGWLAFVQGTLVDVIDR